MLSNYLKIALKVLARRKFFTFVSLFGIGFTLAVLLTVASIADHQLVPSGPEKNLGRALQFNYLQLKGDRFIYGGGPGYGLLDRFLRDIPGVAIMTIYSRNQSVASYREGEKIVSEVKLTDGAFWRVMDFEFLEGGPFSDADDRDGNRVAVIDEATRRKFFDGEDAVGRSLELGGDSYRVVGVVTSVSHYYGAAAANIWAPISSLKVPDFRTALRGGFRALFVAKDRRDFPRIREEFQSRLARVESPEPDRYHTFQADLHTKFQRLCFEMIYDDPGVSHGGRVILYAVLGTLLFMSLPAINLININLSRIYERNLEIGVRKAFGASSVDLAGQFIIENILLCLIGGVIGLLGAGLLLELAEFWVPSPVYLEFELNWRIFLYAIGLATFFGLLSGAWPAWKMSRQHPVESLRGGVR